MHFMNKNMLLFTFIAMGSLSLKVVAGDKGKLLKRCCNLFFENRVPSPFVLPIKYINGYKITQDWTNSDPATRELLIIQLYKYLFIRRSGGYDQRWQMATIEKLPIAKEAKPIIAAKLKMTQEQEVFYYDQYRYNKYSPNCGYDFVHNGMANSLRARLASNKDIEQAQLASNIITEVPLEDIHADAYEGARESLNNYKAQLDCCNTLSKEEKDRRLWPYYKRLTRWQQAPLEGIIYSDNLHDQQEKED